MLIQIAEEFIDSTLLASCQNAKHRKSNTVETKDVQLHLGIRISPLKEIE
jgi:transcription initiation factor TFIID subunit 12